MLAVGGMVIAELIAPPVNFPWWLGIICGIGVTAGIGYVQGSLITRLHIPSFVVTLAGLLFFEGILIELANIDKQAVGGVISVSTSSPVFKLVNSNLSVAASWIGLVVVIAIYAAVSIRRAAHRRAKGLSAPPLSITLFQIGAAAVGGILLVYVCSENRGLLTPLKGVPYVVPFVGIVLLLYSIFLARTRSGGTCTPSAEIPRPPVAPASTCSACADSRSCSAL